MRKKSEERLLDTLRIGSRDEQSRILESLYKSNYARIVSLARRFRLTKEDGQDVLQDALIVLYNQAREDGFELVSSANTYIYAICRNLFLKRLRHHDKMTQFDHDQEFADVEENQLFLLMGSEKEQAVSKAFELLKPDCQQILRLFYYDKLALKLIQERMGFSSVQSVKNKKAKCLNGFKRIILSSRQFKYLLAPESEDNG